MNFPADKTSRAFVKFLKTICECERGGGCEKPGIDTKEAPPKAYRRDASASPTKNHRNRLFSPFFQTQEGEKCSWDYFGEKPFGSRCGWIFLCFRGYIRMEPAAADRSAVTHAVSADEIRWKGTSAVRERGEREKRNQHQQQGNERATALLNWQATTRFGRTANDRFIGESTPREEWKCLMEENMIWVRRREWNA